MEDDLLSPWMKALGRDLHLVDLERIQIFGRIGCISNSLAIEKDSAPSPARQRQIASDLAQLHSFGEHLAI